MRKHHTYDPFICNRLEQLEAPDFNQLWGGMKEILDQEMPEKKDKRRIFWWFFTGQSLVVLGGMAAVSTAAVYHYSNSGEAVKNAPSPAEARITHLRPVTPSPGHTPTEPEGREGDGADQQAASLSLASRPDASNKRSRVAITPPAPRLASRSAGLANDNPTTNPVNTELTDQNSTQTTTITLNEDIRSAHKRLQDARLNTAALSLAGATTSSRVIATGAPATAAKLPGTIVPSRKGWVAGVSFNINLPVGQQQMSSVYMKGSLSAALDYLPSAYLQYHFNDRLSVQTELQLIAPQYTPFLTLSTKTKEVANEKQEQVIALNKLYYMNIPVTLHYSPLKNLRLGSGIQYSHLRRAVFSEELTTWRGADNLWHKTAERKDYHVRSRNGSGMTMVDTAAQSLRGSDWRLVMDANYDWKRFNAGVRVNLGLTSYINTQTASDRNEALQLYLRYNLWESGSRKKR